MAGASDGWHQVAKRDAKTIRNRQSLGVGLCFGREIQKAGQWRAAERYGSLVSDANGRL